MVDMSRYLELFLSETRDHLGHGEERLEDLHRGERGQPVHDLFRHVHSVKGMAASMGFEHISDFAHRLEDVLDLLRDEKIEGDEPLLDLVRQALDHIAVQVDAVEREQPPVAADGALLRRLQDHVDGNGHAPASPASPGEAPAAASAAGPDPAPEATPLRLELVYSRSAQLPAARALVALARLETLGTVLDVDPPRDRITGEGFDGRLRVHLATLETPETLRQRLEKLPDVASASVTEESPEKKTPDADTAPSTPALPATVRVNTRDLDRLLELVGELIVHRSLLRGRLGPSPGQDVEEELDVVSALVSDLHDTVLAMRMLPFETVTQRLSRSVRELARDLGKKVRFEIRGKSVGLDRTLLEEILDPIQHILRNALDHGLEPPVEREAAGKKATGSVVLSLERRGDAIHMTIADDGRGMDPVLLRGVALERGVAEASVLEAMEDEEVLLLTTRPGFSTATRTTAVSGRGVGMDVVRTRIESLGGQLALRSGVGRGTTVHLILPVTISVVESLLVEAAGQTYAVPSGVVHRTVEARPDRVQARQGRPHLVVEGEAVPLHDLGGLLGLEENGDPFAAPRPVFLFQEGARRQGMAVDRILGLREMVIKPLGLPLELLPQLSGATVLESGRVALILDLANLVRAH